MKAKSGNGFLTMGIAFLLFGCYLLFQRYSSSHISFAQTPPTQIAIHAVPPVEMIIPSATIDLPIIPATIHNNTWDVTTAGVSYLTSSPIPGEKGNSILYGHNWTSLLGPLTRVKVGDDITISYADHTTKQFRVSYITVVSPSDVAILKPSSDRRITVYTCTGFLDTKRFVVTAILINNNTISLK